MSVKRPKDKGTGFEREIVQAAELVDIHADRTPPGWPFDMNLVPNGISRWSTSVVRALATRPDRGRALVAVPLDEFLELLSASGFRAELEAKRYARFAHHTIFEETFE